MFNKQDKEQRYIIEKEGMITTITDKRTGVQYITYTNGAGITMTPLLDKDGKPLVVSLTKEFDDK